jgi:ParB family transcriptional regulator, chromosome partitioning protein
LSDIPLQTKDLVDRVADRSTNPLERAKLMHELLSKHNVNKSALAQILKKSPSYVSNYLRLLKLPEVIQDAILSNIITEGHSRALSFLNDQSDIVYLFEEILRHGYSVRATEHLVDKLRSSKRTYGKVNVEIKDVVSEIAQTMGIPIRAQRKGKEIVITMNFPVGVVSLNKLKKIAHALKNHPDTELSE